MRILLNNPGICLKAQKNQFFPQQWSIWKHNFTYSAPCFTYRAFIPHIFHSTMKIMFCFFYRLPFPPSGAGRALFLSNHNGEKTGLKLSFRSVLSLLLDCLTNHCKRNCVCRITINKIWNISCVFDINILLNKNEYPPFKQRYAWECGPHFKHN